MPLTIQQVSTKEKNQWCPGCGDLALLMGFKQALMELAIPTHETVIVSGIGCSGKTPHYIGTYGYEGLHGRVLPLASGIKLGNNRLTVIAVGGDGDGYGIGAGHFTHIMRRNYDMTYIVFNNEVYGLTTGQASPTSQLGMKTKSTPRGVIETPLNPVASAIINGATFVARSFAGDVIHLKKTIIEAVRHKGFSFIDVFQPCVTYNYINTYSWFQQRIYDLQKENHDTSNKMLAIQKAFEDIDTNYAKAPIGVFYKENRATYEDYMIQLKEKPLAKQDINNIDMRKAFDAFR